MVPSHVLVALDGSPLADEALRHALAVYDCPITVLNVVTPVDAQMSEGGVLEPGQQRQKQAHERAERLIDQAKARATAEQRTIQTQVATGDPVEAITTHVEQHDVDHVVMGGHGGERGEIATRLLGTVASSVVNEVPTSVTVIR